MGLSGLKSRCQQGWTSGGSKEESVPLCFPVSRECMNSLAHASLSSIFKANKYHSDLPWFLPHLKTLVIIPDPSKQPRGWLYPILWGTILLPTIYSFFHMYLINTSFKSCLRFPLRFNNVQKLREFS